MTDLARLQGEALAMLVEFDRICRRHGIAYQLAAGTLLGAIRHGGFIPWDDDIDVCLRRAEYERFLAVAPAELSPAYRLRHNGTEPGCGFLFCKIVNAGPESATSRAFVDVFPFDGVRRAPLAAGLHLWTAFFLLVLLAYRCRPATAEDRTPSPVRRWLRRALAWVAMRQHPQRLADRLQRVARWHEGRPTGHVACLVAGRLSYRQLRTEADFDACTDRTFEGHRFPVPCNYETVLENLYGDWRTLPPPKQRRPHHGVMA